MYVYLAPSRSDRSVWLTLLQSMGTTLSPPQRLTWTHSVTVSSCRSFVRAGLGPHMGAQRELIFMVRGSGVGQSASGGRAGL